MRRNKYQYILSDAEVKQLRDIVSKGKTTALAFRNASILLAGNCKDGVKSVKKLSETYHATEVTIYSLISRYKKEGLAPLLQRKKRETPPITPKITADVKAKIIALADSRPPEGSDKWTLTSLAEKSMELGYIDSISRSSVYNILKERGKAS